MTDRICVIEAAIAQLNEITAELVAKVSDDDEFTALAVTQLRHASWALGYEFQGQTGDPELFMTHVEEP